MELQVVYSKKYIKEAMVEPLSWRKSSWGSNYQIIQVFLMQSNKAD